MSNPQAKASKSQSARYQPKVLEDDQGAYCAVCGGRLSIDRERSDYARVLHVFSDNHRACSPLNLLTWTRQLPKGTRSRAKRTQAK
ncbi:hypothetical protein [Acaryochloris marina]|uniref:hypothetical protein n=1 Tax=Acaryochloris marina TaxID=155978 RepID=UPI0005A15AD3|nr:hypothetical protein [Acaryochloris marina]